MLFVVLIILTVALAAYKFVRGFRYWERQGIKQGTQWECLSDDLKTTMKLMSFKDLHMMNFAKYPKSRYLGFYQFGQPMLMLRDADLIKEITVKNIESFANRRIFIPTGIDKYWDSNLFALKGDAWRIMRSTLSPAFTANKMKSMFVLMNETAENFTDYFVNNTKSGKNNHGLIMKDCYRRYASDVIANCAFGYKCDSLTERNNEFYVNGIRLSQFGSLLNSIKIAVAQMSSTLTPYVGLKAFEAKASEFFLGITKGQLKVRQEQNIVRPDMIHLLMEARKGKLQHESAQETNTETGFATAQESEHGKSSQKKVDFSDVDITAQGLFFFIAGFDTVSTALSFISYELALNPEMQERLRREIDETLLKCGGKLTYEALFGMKYMDMFICESLRKWPPILFVDRQLVKPYTIHKQSGFDDEPDELKLQPGNAVILPIFALHHDPKYYPEPEVFNPERFNDENKKNINPYAYLPFGSGGRNCIGSRFALMELKMLFFHLLSKFEIAVNAQTQVPVQISRALFNLDSDDGIFLDYKERTLL